MAVGRGPTSIKDENETVTPVTGSQLSGGRN